VRQLKTFHDQLKGSKLINITGSGMVLGILPEFVESIHEIIPWANSKVHGCYGISQCHVFEKRLFNHIA
jgi:hypothetical protein